MRILPFMPFDDGYEPPMPELNQEEGVLDITHPSDCQLIEESKLGAETLVLRCALRPIALQNKDIHVQLIAEGETLNATLLYEEEAIVYGYAWERELSCWHAVALEYTGIGRGVHEGESFVFYGTTLPFGKLEAFTTSGGASTLIDTYKNRLRNLDYKTIRYPGHASIMRSFYELGFFSNEAITNATNKTSYKPRDVAAFLLEKNIPLCTNDAVLVKIIFQGGSKKHELTIIDKSTDYPLLTAMMRTTAFPASIIASMLARGDIKKTGVLPQEECIPTELFIAELEKRNIRISGLTQNRLRGVDFTRSS